MVRMIILLSFGTACWMGCAGGTLREAEDSSSEATTCEEDRSSPTFAGLLLPGQDAQTGDEHTEWISESLKTIQTLKPGDTRQDLLKLFTTEGGLYTRTQGHFVYRKCPYVKVDVEFKTADNDIDHMDPNDVIAKISKPYLEWTIAD